MVSQTKVRKFYTNNLDQDFNEEYKMISQSTKRKNLTSLID